MDNQQIRRGISLYSFQEKYYTNKLSLEQCVATASGMGVRGIEMLSDQMIPGYPSITFNLSDEFIENWKLWMSRYRVEPVAFDIYGETRLFRNRNTTADELLSELLALMKTAKVLDFSILRLTFHLPISIVEALIPHAEESGIRLAIEVHSPHLLTGEWVNRNLELAARKNTKNLGIMPDLGIFCRHIPHLVIEEAFREGATPRIVDFLKDVYESGKKSADLMEQVAAMGGNEADMWLAQRMVIGVWTYHDPKHLLDVLPYTFHIHGKFYEMNESLVEPDVAYDAVMPTLIKGGYNGYIMSEYEGQRLIGGIDKGYDEIEQVRRHQAMLARYLDGATKHATAHRGVH
jgi:sugar phosphate isomerase/epimerase